MTDSTDLLEIEAVNLQAVEWRVFRDAVALSVSIGHQRPLSSVDDLYPIIGAHSTAKNRASVISPLARKGLLTEFRSDGIRVGGAKSWTVVFSKAVRCAGHIVYQPVPGREVGDVIVSEATGGAPTSVPTRASGVFPEVHFRLYRNGSETERPRVNRVTHATAMELFGEYFSGTTKGGVVRDFLRTQRMTRDGDDFLVLEPEAWEARQGEAAAPVVVTEIPIPRKKMSDMWRVFWDAAPSEASNGERLCSRTHALQMLADNGFSGRRLASMLGALVTHKAVHWLDDTRMTLVVRGPDRPSTVVSVTRVPDAPAPAVAPLSSAPALKSRVELEEDFDLMNAAIVAGEADRRRAEAALVAAHAEVQRLEGELLNLPGLGEVRARRTALRQIIDNYDLLVKA